MNPLPANEPELQPLPTSDAPTRPPAVLDALPDAAPVALQVTTQAVAVSPGTSVAAAHPIRRGHRGKIARLPGPLRDMVNRMLHNNIPYSLIVGALDEQGVRVTQRNISNWKTWGGYNEWRLAQDHAAALHVHQDNLLSLLRRENASEVPEVGLQVAATRLSEFFVTPQADQLLASDPQEYRRRATHLAQLTIQIKNLQKYRDDSARKASFHYDPERNRRDNEKEIERTRKTFSSKLGKSAKDPDIAHRNYLAKSSE